MLPDIFNELECKLIAPPIVDENPATTRLLLIVTRPSIVMEEAMLFIEPPNFKDPRFVKVAELFVMSTEPCSTRSEWSR